MAKKYIDADKLKAEIERQMDEHWDNLPDADSPEDDWTHNELCELGAYKELEHIEYFLASLQQEHQEIDLEEASIFVWEAWNGGTMDDVRRAMKELGRIVEPLRIAKYNTEEENGTI